MQMSIGSVILDLIASAMIVVGSVLWAVPIVVYWWMHGSYARYMWVIQGPYPFSHFGSGPGMLWAGIACLLLSAMLCASGVLLKLRIWHRHDIEVVLS